MLKVIGLAGPGYGPVDAYVEAGMCLAIIGESGSGKTRLLRGIADLDPAEGQCSLGETPRSQIPAPTWRQRVAFVPAEPGWWATMPADHFDNVQRCFSLAGGFGVDDASLHRPVEQLSTGERQRLALVRALQFDPEILLLDEPTGPLDAETTEKVEGEILRRIQSGAGVILVTHDRSQAARLGAVVSLMEAGRLSPVAVGGAGS